MESDVPLKIFPGDFHRLRHFHHILGAQCLPFFGLVIAEAGGVFPPQGNDKKPYLAGVGCNFLRHLRRHELIFLSGKQSAGSDTLGTGAGGDILLYGCGWDRHPYGALTVDV